MSDSQNFLSPKIRPSPIPGAGFPGFNDLSSLDVVRMPTKPLWEGDDYKNEEIQIIHLTITGQCYARCMDCVNSAVTLGSDDPRDTVITAEESVPQRDATIIKKLAALHPDRMFTVCFYGGEPFLRLELMEEVWSILARSDESERFRFMVITNGELLEDAMTRYPEFMRDIWLYAVSIDGDEEQHDRIRLGTCLSHIRENLKSLSAFYRGNILQWSTLREDQSLFRCFEEFLRLYEEGLVNHFFWHWAESRKPMDDFRGFVRRYGLDLKRIIDIYIKRIYGGEILPIAHVNELILYLLTARKRGHTACGVEMAENYDIVSGKVFPCADLPGCSSIGRLDEEGELKIREHDLESFIEYKEWLGCYECGVSAYCGGRCPVQIRAGSVERAYQCCQLMRLHVGIVQERIEDILTALKTSGATLQSIYDNSAFLAKYTDVVP
ncbi:MAG: 4Fe-4S cluster-binding domain-containing protein [Candidatus Aminicenantales bacterium]